MKFIHPTHLYKIQAACGSLGTSLDIKFFLNSQRIVQPCLSNYHWFVIMGRGKRLKEGCGDESQRCSGPIGTQRDQGFQRYSEPKHRSKQRTQRYRGFCVDSAFAHFFSLSLSNSTVRVHTPSAPFWQAFQQKEPGKRRDFLCFWIKKQRHEEDHGGNFWRQASPGSCQRKEGEW